MPIVIKVKAKREELAEKRHTSWASKKADWEKFRESKETFAEEVEDGKLKEMVDKVTEKMIREANKCIPKKKVGNGNKPY